MKDICIETPWRLRLYIWNGKCGVGFSIWNPHVFLQFLEIIVCYGNWFLVIYEPKNLLHNWGGLVTSHSHVTLPFTLLWDWFNWIQWGSPPTEGCGCILQFSSSWITCSFPFYAHLIGHYSHMKWIFALIHRGHWK